MQRGELLIFKSERGQKLSYAPVYLRNCLTTFFNHELTQNNTKSLNLSSYIVYFRVDSWLSFLNVRVFKQLLRFR